MTTPQKKIIELDSLTTPPSEASAIPISAAGKTYAISWANLKAHLRSFFDNIYRQSVVSQNVTTSNIAASANVIYILDLSGLTANRDISLPTPSAAGLRIRVRISNGNGTYALIVKRAAVEVTRLFITGETIEFTSTGALPGSWVVTHDGRINCKAIFRRITSNSDTTHAADTPIKATWNDISLNEGNCGELVNIRFNVRRVSYYKVSGAYAPTGITDQKYGGIRIYKNGTGGTIIGTILARQSSSTSSSVFGVAIAGRLDRTMANVGDYYEYYFLTEETNRGLLRSDITGVLTESPFFQVEEVLGAI